MLLYSHPAEIRGNNRASCKSGHIELRGVFSIVLTIPLQEKYRLQTQARLKLLTTLREKPSLGNTMTSSKAKERLTKQHFHNLFITGININCFIN